MLQVAPTQISSLRCLPLRSSSIKDVIDTKHHGTIYHRGHVAGLFCQPKGRLSTRRASLVDATLPLLVSHHPGLYVGIGMNTLVYILGNGILLKGLALDGFLSSWVLGCASFSAFGVYGYALVCLYFLLGSWVTKVRMDVKIREGTAEAKGGRRGIGSVLGSGLAGMVCAVLALSEKIHGIPMVLLQIGFVTSFCSKLFDTVSSEIGKAYGKTTYLATTFERVPRGTEGAVSLEGTVAGMSASVFLGCCAVLLGMITPEALLYVITASFIANYAESIIGAIFQGRVEWLTNDLVNIIQITIASCVSILLSYYFVK